MTIDRSIGPALTLLAVMISVAAWSHAHAQLISDGFDSGDQVNEVQVNEVKGGDIFVLGNVVFALLHETGHAVIGDFAVPILGLEENSADTIAAVTLVSLDRVDPNADFDLALGVTALVQAYVWEAGIEKEGAQVALWAQHGLSAQRFARLVCLLYGSDPQRYGWAAEAAGMAEIRADGCEQEWRVAERAVLWLRDNYGIAPGQRADVAPESIEVRYGPALNPGETADLELLQRHEVLPRLANLLQTRFAFPRPLTIHLNHCREPNAYWDPEYRELVLCYELMTAFRQFADRPEVSRLVEQFKAGQRKNIELPQAQIVWPVDQDRLPEGVT